MKIAIFACALTLLAPQAAQAASPRAGFELFGSLPTQGLKTELTTSRLGAGAGFFLEWDLERGNAIRWNLNRGTTFANRDIFITTSGTGASTYKRSLEATRVTSTVDFHFSPSGTQDGLYLLAGLGVGSVVAEASLKDIITVSAPEDSRLDPKAVLRASTGTRLQWKVGAGYRFDENWGATVSYTAMTHRSRQLGTVDFGVNYRF